LRQWEFVVLTEKETIENIILPVKNLFPKERIDKIIKEWDVDAPIQRDMYEDALPKQYSMLIQSCCLILPFYKQHTPLLKPEWTSPGKVDNKLNS
jgi:hypothetical protein